MDAEPAPAPRLVSGRMSRSAALQMIIGNPVGIFRTGRGTTSRPIARGVDPAVIIPRSPEAVLRIRRETSPDIEQPTAPPPAEELWP